MKIREEHSFRQLAPTSSNSAVIDGATKIVQLITVLTNIGNKCVP